MANLEYRREFFKDDQEASNESVYLQLRQTPIQDDWIERVRRQDYETGTSILGDDIFAIDGITDLSIQPFRVWLSISPVYNFDEIVPQVLDKIRVRLTLDGLSELSASPTYLTTSKERLDP